MSVCFEITQPSENALAIKIRDKILDKIKDCKTEEELQETLLSIFNENEDRLDLEKIQEDREVSRLIDGFIACSIDENPDNLDNTQVQIGSLLRNAIDLVCNPPTFTIPYPYPVIDVTGDFLNKIKLALIRLAINILLSLIKKLISLINEICRTGLSALNGYGLNNLADIIASSIGEEVSQSFINDVFSVFGINTDGTAATLTFSDEVACEEDFSEAVSNIKDVNKFLDDLSMMATPVELCSLLNNNANDTTLLMVEELLDFEYPQMRKRLNTRNKIVDLFKTLGTRADPSICDLIEQNADAIIAAPELCFTNDTNTLRENLLRERNLTDEQIKNVLDRERQRTKDNLQKLVQLSTQIRTNPNEILGTAPEFFCKGTQPGILSMDDMPYLKNSVTKSLDATFTLFATTYFDDSSNFVDDVLSVSVTPNLDEPILAKFVDTTVLDNNNELQIIENSLNTKFMQKVASGQFVLCDPFGRTDKSSLLDYYEEIEINGNNVVNDDVIDVQTLINTTNINAFSGEENVFIKNYDYTTKVMPDVINICNKIEQFITLDYENLSINFAIPNKFVSINDTNNEGDFSLLPSVQTITLFTVSGSNL